MGGRQRKCPTFLKPKSDDADDGLTVRYSGDISAGRRRQYCVLMEFLIRTNADRPHSPPNPSQPRSLCIGIGERVREGWVSRLSILALLGLVQPIAQPGARGLRNMTSAARSRGIRRSLMDLYCRKSESTSRGGFGGKCTRAHRSRMD